MALIYSEERTPALISKFRIARIFGAFLLLGLVGRFPAAYGQQSSPPSVETHSQNDDQNQSLGTIKVDVNAVQLFFNVKNKQGTLITSLAKDDFEILEDGKGQAIRYFASESNLPLTVGILIDSSGSQERVLQTEKKAGGEFLSEILRDHDLAFVMSFDVNVNLLQDFTNSGDVLQTALDSAHIDTNGGRTTGAAAPGGEVSVVLRGTLLYDAVYLASNDEFSRQVGRKAMILLTDGEDQGSQMGIRDAIEAAQKSNSIIYVLLCADRKYYSGEYSGEGKMNRLAQETGGRVIVVGNRVDKLKSAFAQISYELRNQYSIGYTPANSALDGTLRKVEIHAKNKNYKVQARTAYYALPTRDATQTSVRLH